MYHSAKRPPGCQRGVGKQISLSIILSLIDRDILSVDIVGFGPCLLPALSLRPAPTVQPHMAYLVRGPTQIASREEREREKKKGRKKELKSRTLPIGDELNSIFPKLIVQDPAFGCAF